VTSGVGGRGEGLIGWVGGDAYWVVARHGLNFVLDFMSLAAGFSFSFFSLCGVARGSGARVNK